MSEVAGRLGELVGHRFRDAALAETALSHTSYANEKEVRRSNERLEYLGDAVLDMVIARMLYTLHPEWTEGELTRARASMVNKRALAERARVLGLADLVRLGKTERRGGGSNKHSILANCFEAVIGAVYLDGGMEPVDALVERLFGEAVSHDEVHQDAKTAFQEWAHAEHRVTPRYRTVEDSGIEDDDGRFTVEVTLEDAAHGRGVGRTKREAELEAARAALRTQDGS